MTFKRLFNHAMSFFIHGYLLRQLYFTQRNGMDALSGALLAFALVWLVMSMVLFFFKIQCRVLYPEAFSQLRTFEGRSFYEKLGIRLYRWMLLHSPFRFANTSVYLKDKRGKAALLALRTKILEAEWAHIINLLLVLIAMLFYAEIRWWLLLWNVVFNVYPVFLQRYHRLRIEQMHFS
jgi:hypothetical protein